MARFKDELPSNMQKGWLHELARAELHPDAEKLFQLSNSLDPQQLVEESTVDFLTTLRESFTENSKIFNTYSEGGSRFQEIKIFSIAQTPADFMIFRNQVKLVVSNSAHGVITLQYAQHHRNSYAVDGSLKVDSDNPETASLDRPQELMAQIGPFRNVFWTFQGEKVNPSEVAKFYFAEFVRATRDVSKSKAGNEILLKQIKSLLQEKGIDL